MPLSDFNSGVICVLFLFSQIITLHVFLVSLELVRESNSNHSYVAFICAVDISPKVEIYLLYFISLSLYCILAEVVCVEEQVPRVLEASVTSYIGTF